MPDTSTPPFLLIRVQDALHGATFREDGLYLPYRRDGMHGEHRNTSHWAVNAVGADHAYGSFSQAADGSLKGSVVIVADPRDLPTPAGLGQVDTWFRMDATPDADGRLERGLSVGPRAVMIVPHGVDVPQEVNVVRYDGTLEQRDAAVANVVAERGVSLEQAGMWGWTSSQDAAAEWAQAMVDRHYPHAGRAVHVGAHAGSLDDTLENGVRLEGLLERFEHERLFERSDGAQVPMTDEIRRVSAEQQDVLNEIMAALSSAERTRVGAFYDQRRCALDAVEQRTQALETVWAQRLNDDQALGAGVANTVLPPPLPGATGRTMPPPLPRLGTLAVPPPLPSVLPPPMTSVVGAPPPLPLPAASAPGGAGTAGWRPQALNPSMIDTWCDQRSLLPALPSNPAVAQVTPRRLSR